MVTQGYKKIVDGLQWMAIGLLFIMCLIVFIGNKRLSANKQLMKENTYVRIYESQTIESLKKENAALNDSIITLNSYIKEK